MKCIKADLPEEMEELVIEIFADLHIGSAKCDYKLIQDRVRELQERKNAYAIIIGDVINNSTKSSVGDVYEEELPPMQQIKSAITLFTPIKDKILGVCSGNHERRTYKTEGIDLLYFFCCELGIQDRYDYASAVLFLRFGLDRSKNIGRNSRKMYYTLYMAHGDGQGGKTIGGKANGLQKRGQIIDADIIVTGHTHAPFCFRDSCFTIDGQNNCVRNKEQLFVNASASLNYEQYAEIYGMKPSSKISPRIILDGHKKKFWAVL